MVNEKSQVMDGKHLENSDAAVGPQRRSYSAPHLVRWGSMESLTQNATMAADDTGTGGGDASGSS